MKRNEQLIPIFERRSVRKYTDQVISDEEINLILEAAMYAPSAVNKQPWHFIVVSQKKTFRKITEIHPNASFLEGASHAILICGDEKLQHDEGYYLADCGATTQNILLAAQGLGIGSCWIGIFPREARQKSIAELFRLPDHVQPFALVSLGFPDETKKQPDRFSPEKIHREYWSNKSGKE